MTFDDIAVLESLEASATKGPWVAKRTRDQRKCDGIGVPHSHPAEVDCWEVDDCPGQTEIVTTDSGYYGPSLKDADLIVALRNAAPELISLAKDALEIRARIQKFMGGE